MSKLKHTPGPWVKDYGHTEGHIKTLHNPEVHTKTVIKYRYNMCEEILTEEEIEANACFIAVVSEMFEVLIDAYCNMDSGNFKKIESIVEKATGMNITEVLEILNEN